ncbi:MAG: PQQ-binding-like beta-propeller repeat protein, partial [bacterium]
DLERGPGRSSKAQERGGENWPSFRGSNASGVAENYQTPITWNVENSQNIKWKTEITGLGHSSPIIWGDRVYVTTAISGMADPTLKVGLYGNIDPVEDNSVHKWLIYCLDKNTGNILWEKTALEAVPRIKRHTKATHANSTPATDGKHLVTFLGSEGLFCYDMNGKALWRVDLGDLDAGYFRVPEAQWGFASSPIIFNNTVIVQCDVQKNSFIAAFDIKSGKEIWRTSRDEVPTWGSPTVYTKNGRTQVIVNGWKHIGAYDFDTGQEIWKMRGGGDIPVPTPVLGHGLVYIANAHGSQGPLYAIRLNATGNITLEDGASSSQSIAWSHPNNRAYMQTPIVYGDYIYSCRNNGGLHCYDAKTGEEMYRQRLGTGRTGFTASPVAGDGKLYFTSEDGDVYVIKAGPTYELLAQNQMGEICMATPAISEGALFFRTKKNLVAVAVK